MTAPASTVSPSASGMAALIVRIFAADGASETEARAIADNLVGTNLAGHDSHGVVRVPRYLLAVKRSQMHYGRHVETILDGGAFALLDGGLGFGQTIGAEAVEAGLGKAHQLGVAIIGLRHAGHLGRIGEWAEMACRAGVVSIHFVNVARSMLVAPFGGAERRISTAPICIGVVNPNGDDFILDFATSKIAEGKVLVALKGGKPPPVGALVDEHGHPTQDPRALYGEVPPGTVPNPRAGKGALLTMGDHKGSGLALACELLAGALTGSGTTGPGEGIHNGMLSIYIAPDSMNGGSDYGAAVSDYIDFVRDSRPADPAKPVMIPGDPERMARHQRLKTGLPLSTDAFESILAAGDGVGLERAEMKRILEAT